MKVWPIQNLSIHIEISYISHILHIKFDERSPIDGELKESDRNGYISSEF
jgi:hypothetical protein